MSDYNNNDPELDGKFLGTVSKDFVIVCDTIKEAAYQLKVRGLSDYPIFPICKAELPIGQLLLGKKRSSHRVELLYFYCR